MLQTTAMGFAGQAGIFPSAVYQKPFSYHNYAEKPEYIIFTYLALSKEMIVDFNIILSKIEITKTGLFVLIIRTSV
jgi:hypothetical protein